MSDRELLHELNRKVDKIMGDLTAQNAAIAQLQTDVTALLAQSSGSSDQAAIDANTAELTALDAQVQAALTPATGTTPVPPPVTPSPEPEAPARADVP